LGNDPIIENTAGDGPEIGRRVQARFQKEGISL
jgi:hypothetical protein